MQRIKSSVINLSNFHPAPKISIQLRILDDLFTSISDENLCPVFLNYSYLGCALIIDFQLLF